jgi:ubiquinol-cytochrome c reductase iron-sulfur subunit
VSRQVDDLRTPSPEGTGETIVEERRAERRVAISFLVCAAAAVGLAVVYLRGGDPQLEGVLLAVALGGLAVGFVMWANHLMPRGPFVDERHDPAATEEELEEMEADVERGGILTRRKLILRTLAVAVGGLGAAALFPIRSLGPNPGTSLVRTPWRDGLRLVTEDGRPVRIEEVPVEGLVTVFPEGHPGSADGQAVLVRVAPGLISPLPGREDWAPAGFVAYSKVCTHAGCPVGLYQAESHELLCPCHQSSFDVLHHATPTFGPAAAPLPQLPLRIDTGGFLVARGDFSEPVGPVFWRRA